MLRLYVCLCVCVCVCTCNCICVRARVSVCVRVSDCICVRVREVLCALNNLTLLFVKLNLWTGSSYYGRGVASSGSFNLTFDLDSQTKAPKKRIFSSSYQTKFSIEKSLRFRTNACHQEKVSLVKQISFRLKDLPTMSNCVFIISLHKSRQMASGDYECWLLVCWTSVGRRINSV